MTTSPQFLLFLLKANAPMRTQIRASGPEASEFREGQGDSGRLAALAGGPGDHNGEVMSYFSVPNFTSLPKEHPMGWAIDKTSQPQNVPGRPQEVNTLPPAAS